jgi:hypothetical protein
VASFAGCDNRIAMSNFGDRALLDQNPLELAARYPEIPASIVLIDSLVFPRQSILDALQSMVEALRGPDYQAVYQQAILSLCLPTDNETRKTELIASLPKAPQHVVASAFTNHVTDYDSVLQV